MFTLPWLELSRFRRHVITRLAMVVMIVIPTLYGGLYLASSWDPTGNLDRLDAAVVDLDEGADVPAGPGGDEKKDPEHLEAGDELTENLTGQDDAGFTWHETSAEDAKEGLDKGDYYAVLTIPADFSENLVSTAGDTPEQAGLEMQTNDATSFIIGSVSDSVLRGITESLNETTTSEYVNEVYLGFNDMYTQTEKAADGADQLHDGSTELHDGTGDLVEGTGELKTGAGELHSGLIELSDGADDLADGANQLETGAGDLADGAGTLAEGTETAKTGSKDLADGASQLADGTSVLATTADEATTKVNDFHDQASDLVDQTEPVITQAADDFGSTRDTVRGDVTDTVEKLQEQYPDDPNVAELATQIEGLGNDLDSAESTASGAVEDAKDLKSDVETTADEVVTKVNEADTKIGELDDGAQQLSDGADDLHTGLTDLDTGADQLSDGADELAGGATDLSDGADQLATGAQDAQDGSKQLSDGAVALDEGAVQLDDGALQLEDGSKELADGLEAGLEQIPNYDKEDRENRSDVVALPVDAEHQKDNAVDYYGEGLAPFFLGLALWIGGMITYMVLKAIPYRALASTASSIRIAWAGYVPGFLFGVLQVLFLWTVLAFMLDFTVSSWLWTLLFSILIAGTFQAVHQMTIVIFGSLGRLVGLVLLMLQIGAAGGTYPVETAPQFFQTISPLLPMTYAVKGLRTMIAGGDMWIAVQCASALLVFLVGALVISCIACNARRMVRMKDLHPSFEL